ncbi:uncharacterized protein LOC129745842 [Uranotaenia lowii]|uniref:uncharacterized protein LOC129745842 n=1 Tax=Uranotaenia lowii TaxID=190385 RepID=UPI00247ACDAA|nr:uncharacterized protein LOC129745842 [Uranotaenia lowii]
MRTNSTSDYSDNSIVINYHDIYSDVQQSTDSGLDRLEEEEEPMMCITTGTGNPPAPPSYNQLPGTEIISAGRSRVSSGGNQTIVIVSSTNNSNNQNLTAVGGGPTVVRGDRGGGHSSVIIVQSGPSTSTGFGHQGRRGDPPSYDEVINPEAPPPSYDSLFGRVREAHKSSTGMMDFLKNVVILLLGTLGCTIILGITIVIPVCMIVFGFVYLYDCPQGEYIPVYLLVGGGFGVLKQLLHLSTRVRSREDQELERLRQSPTQTLINCFMLGWFIIGSFWIYRIYEPNYDPALGKYCNKSLYLFTFWLITSVYMALGFITVVLCGVSLISIAIHRRT